VPFLEPNYNPLDFFDNYKHDHAKMFPKGTTAVQLYYAGRGGELPYLQLVCLQYILKRYLTGAFFTQADLDEKTEQRKRAGRTFHPEIWQYILDKYQGRLPISIHAIKEGKKVGLGNALFRVDSEDSECFWLPGALEDILHHAWHPSGVCVLSSHIYEITKQFLEETSDNVEAALPYMLNDFGMRSSVNMDAAAVASFAHLLNFRGSDSGDIGETFARRYYGLGKYTWLYDAVDATEHSVMTALGKAGEVQRVGEILDKHPTGLISIVGDSYDIYNFTENIIGGVYRDRIAARLGKVVIRPDSDDPLVVVPRLLTILADKFGYTTNSKGYRVLSPCVGLIWGDGMDRYSIRRVYALMKSLGWSAENLVVGMGGGLVQKINRDSQHVAMKNCSQTRDGVEYDIWKEAKGKVSHRGKVALVWREERGVYETVNPKDVVFPLVNEHELTYHTGELKRDMTFEEIAGYSKIPFLQPGSGIGE
jgi:nicotinamide phosphoribosyltransferase